VRLWTIETSLTRFNRKKLRLAYKHLNDDFVQSSRVFTYYLAFLGDFILGVEFVALPIKGYILGANSFEIGLLGGASSAIYSFLPFIAGKLGDKIGSKIPVTAFLLTYPLITLVYFMSYSLSQLIIVRVIEGLEWPFYWPSLEYTVSVREGRSGIRNYNLSWGLGALAGPFAGGALVYAVGASRSFEVLTVLVIASAMISLFTFKGEREKVVTRDSGKGKLNLMYIVTAFAFGFAGTGFLSYFPVTAYRLDISSLYVGVYEALMGLFRVVAMVSTGALLSKIGNKTFRVIALVLAGSFIAPLGLLYGSVFWAVSPMLLGLFLGIAYAISIHGVLENEGSRGSKAGAFESAIGAGSFLGPMFLGFSASYFLHFIFAAYVAMAIGGVMLLLATAIASRFTISLRSQLMLAGNRKEALETCTPSAHQIVNALLLQKSSLDALLAMSGKKLPQEITQNSTAAESPCRDGRNNCRLSLQPVADVAYAPRALRLVMYLTRRSATASVINLSFF